MWQALLRCRRLAAGVLGAGAIVLLALATTASSAFALTLLKKPVAIAATTGLTGPPSVSVDASGDALIGWEDSGPTGDVVHYCVLPVNATSCSQQGMLTPADGAQYVDGVHTLVDGQTMIVLADVYGTAGNSGPNYAPEQEWQSTDGGATWSIVDNGLSVASGILSAGTQPLSGVIVPGTNTLGFGWDTAFGPPTFNAFPLSNPPQCAGLQAGCPGGFATLDPSTNSADQLGNMPGEFASDPSGPAAGVMGVFTDLSPLGFCPGGGTAFVYGSGAQSSSNNYNASPGQPNSAWRVPLSPVDCSTITYPAVGGGPSGFGILDAERGKVVYHRFDATHNAFDTAAEIVDGSGQGEEQSALSQDGKGGIYGTYLLTPAGRPLMLAYSADGGRTFSRAQLLPGSESIVDSTSSVNGPGQGWLSWIRITGSNNTGTMYAEPFRAGDSVLPPLLGKPVFHGPKLMVPVTCQTYPAVLKLVLTAPETVVIRHRRRSTMVTLINHRFSCTSPRVVQLPFKFGGGALKALGSGRVKFQWGLSSSAQNVTVGTLGSIVGQIAPGALNGISGKSAQPGLSSAVGAIFGQPQVSIPGIVLVQPGLSPAVAAIFGEPAQAGQANAGTALAGPPQGALSPAVAAIFGALA